MDRASKYLDRLDVEENAIGKDSALLSAYNKQSKEKAYKAGSNDPNTLVKKDTAGSINDYDDDIGDDYRNAR